MATDFGCWWRYDNLKGDYPTVIVSKEDFSMQEANALVPQLSHIRHHWLCSSGYVKVSVGERQFYAIFSRDTLASLTLPHSYPGGRRSSQGLRTLDTNKLVGFEVLGHFDESGQIVGRRVMLKQT
jgi:hypothetical protein